MSKLYSVCDEDTIFDLSKLCVNGSDDGSLPCLPDDGNNPYHIALGVWAIIVIVFAVPGNILTLLAIPYAAQKQR